MFLPNLISTKFLRGTSEKKLSQSEYILLASQSFVRLLSFDIRSIIELDSLHIHGILVLALAAADC